MSEADTGLMDYLAWRLFADDCKQRQTIPPLWLCVREEVRLKFLAAAKKQYMAWCREERAAEIRRAYR